MANIADIQAEIASLKESLRIKNQSLANINPNYQMNQAYIARLKDEIAAQNASLASAEAALKKATTPAKVKPSRANTETKVTGTPYDDDGNLNPGWAINPETGDPYYIGTQPIDTNSTVPAGGDPMQEAIDAAQATASDESPTEQVVIDATDDPQLTKEDQAKLEAEQAANRAALQEQEALDSRWPPIQGLKAATQSKATKDDTTSFEKKPDWRVRLSLSPGANYLYKVGDGQAGILNPLQKTDGVIFPYTPAISVTYTAGYDSSDIVHSNYKVFQYKGSSVDNLQITGEFTAQDTNEANYLLAVIHFFRSVTKMFYGQDQNPKPGVPPPLLYLSGMGTYQYDAHPLAITNFTYSLPTDVDYIRAGSQTNQPGQNLAGQQTPVNTNSLQQLRTMLNKLVPSAPTWSNQKSLINSEATYVPTKMQIQLSAIPVVTRNDISNRFSLEKYATGELLRGSKNSGGGIW